MTTDAVPSWIYKNGKRRDENNWILGGVRYRIENETTSNGFSMRLRPDGLLEWLKTMPDIITGRRE